MDFLTILHLFIYPVTTGVLFCLFAINLIDGNRWVILTGPMFMTLLVLTVRSFEHYVHLLSY